MQLLSRLSPKSLFQISSARPQQDELHSFPHHPAMVLMDEVYPLLVVQPPNEAQHGNVGSHWQTQFLQLIRTALLVLRSKSPFDTTQVSASSCCYVIEHSFPTIQNFDEAQHRVVGPHWQPQLLQSIDLTSVP